MHSASPAQKCSCIPIYSPDHVLARPVKYLHNSFVAAWHTTVELLQAHSQPCTEGVSILWMLQAHSQPCTEGASMLWILQAHNQPCTEGASVLSGGMKCLHTEAAQTAKKLHKAWKTKTAHNPQSSARALICSNFMHWHCFLFQHNTGLSFDPYHGLQLPALHL